MINIKIWLKLQNENSRIYATPTKEGDRLDHLAWCLQEANIALNNNTPLWAVEKIFISNMEKSHQTKTLIGNAPKKYEELLQKLFDIKQMEKITSLQVTLPGLVTDGPIAVEFQQVTKYSAKELDNNYKSPSLT